MTDETETIRREMVAEINAEPGSSCGPGSQTRAGLGHVRTGQGLRGLGICRSACGRPSPVGWRAGIADVPAPPKILLRLSARVGKSGVDLSASSEANSQDRQCRISCFWDNSSGNPRNLVPYPGPMDNTVPRLSFVSPTFWKSGNRRGFLRGLKVLSDSSSQKIAAKKSGRWRGFRGIFSGQFVEEQYHIAGRGECTVRFSPQRHIGQNPFAAAQVAFFGTLILVSSPRLRYVYGKVVEISKFNNEPFGAVQVDVVNPT